MKIISLVSVAAVMALILLTSCSTLRVGSPVKAGYEVEEPSWALRYIPGLKAISDLIPPPNEARTKWDEAQKKTETLSGRPATESPDLGSQWRDKIPRAGRQDLSHRI